MSILDQRKLIASIHPFDVLDSVTLDSLMQKIDIAYYPKETLLFSKSVPSVAFYIIIKGSVVEYIDEEIHNVYNQGDSFDANALIYDTTNSKFLVDEDLICYEITKEDFLDLMQIKEVQHYFLQDFVSRHQHLKDYATQSELSGFLMARIGDIFLHPACIVKPDVSIKEALLSMQELQTTAIIVDSNPLGIVTDTNLRTHVLLGSVPIDAPISEIATQGIIDIDKEDFLFNALLKMTQSSIKRIVVTFKGQVIGLLEQIDLLSYFANHSHIVAVQVDKAQSIEDLHDLQDQLHNLIIALRAKGVKTRYITKLVSTLNDKVYKKVFDMCVPHELQNSCALIVMGSEGRSEQSIKTDQDNALIIDNRVDKELFIQPMLTLNAHLEALGFPPCKGNVMVSNPAWRKSAQEFKRDLQEWTHSMREEDMQNLSIFLDASCVAGDSSLLEALKAYTFEAFEARDDLLAHMAKAVLHFETPLSLFTGFVLEKEHDNKLNLKKGGIFALVHGVRTLCLKHKINETNTIERIKQLNNRGVIDKTFATELIESFDTLSTLRLSAQLQAKSIDEGNYINPKNLSKIERDLLKDSFKVVNSFKRFMSFDFHLNMVG